MPDFPAPAPSSRPEVTGYAVLHFLAADDLDVWLGIRISDALRVALKIPRCGDAEARAMLHRAAGPLRALRHPNVAALLEVTSTLDGRPVLVMELLAGSPLAAQIPAGGYPFSRALRILLPVLDAVEVAHAQGIVHGALRPAKIFLGGDGVPRVIDFGLARPCAGEASGPCADIRALAALLYEMLSGTAPPTGPWPPLSTEKALDVRVDEVLAAARQAEPDGQVADVESFRDRLVAIRDSAPRLAGLPLTTPAVRVLDFAWTCGGLCLTTAGGCATLVRSGAAMPAVSALTQSARGPLVTGFQQTWLLSLGVGGMALWQILRLVRFRYAPLAESLPGPFGVPLGRTRWPRLLAGMTLLLCVLLPVFFTLTAAARCLQWWSPQMPEQQECLAVTSVRNDVPLSPWTRAGEPDDAADYCLREGRSGPPGTGPVLTGGGVRFYPFFQPLLMVLAATVTAVALLLTAMRLVREGRYNSRSRVSS